MFPYAKFEDTKYITVKSIWWIRKKKDNPYCASQCSKTHSLWCSQQPLGYSTVGSQNYNRSRRMCVHDGLLLHTEATAAEATLDIKTMCRQVRARQLLLMNEECLYCVSHIEMQSRGREEWPQVIQEWIKSPSMIFLTENAFVKHITTNDKYMLTKLFL